MRFILSILLSLFIGVLSAQPFNKTYHDDDGNLAGSVVFNGNGFMMCGIGFSNTYGGWLAAKIVTVDSNGNLGSIKSLGKQSYGFRVGSSGSMVKLKDGNFAYAGSIMDSDELSCQGLLCKISPLGDTLMIRRFGRQHRDYYYFEQAKETFDKGFIMVGKKLDSNNLYRFVALKTDSNGQLQWEKTYGTPGLGHCYSVEVTADHGFIMAGASDANSTVGGRRWPFVVKTDSVGNIQWQHAYDTLAVIYGQASVTQNKSGGYYTWGYFDSQTVTEQVYLTKLDSAGEIVWRHLFDSPPNTFIGHVREQQDGNIVLVGVKQLPNTLDEVQGGWIVKMDALGNLKWERHFPRLGIYTPYTIGNFYDFQTTSDSGFVICGGALVDTAGDGRQDFWLVKTDSLGCIGTDCGVTGLEEISSTENIPTTLHIYPNPAANQVTIEIPPTITDDAKWAVYNLLGQQIATGKTQGQPNVKMEVSVFQKGWYVVKIIAKDKSYVGKFLVE